MDAAEFRRRGREMIDYICDYMENLQMRNVTSDVEPGFLKKLIPTEAPQEPEEWENIMADVDEKIMRGITHWQHPRFHAYFPSGNSYPSILADMLSDAIGCIGFSWSSSPSCAELETIVLDWFAKAMGLPEFFLSTSSRGGGVIQASASECILTSMLAARADAIKKIKDDTVNEDSESFTTEDSVLLPRLVAYCSADAHSCVEKAAMIALVKLRILESDENNSLRGFTLEKAIEEDLEKGLVPFFISTTLGTTSTCAFDKLDEIGPIAKKYGAWLHVDAAYAGNSFICPELRDVMTGIEFADSFNTNTNKWLLVNFDCSTMWVRDRYKLTSALTVNPLYLQHDNEERTIDYRHWVIPLSRRFRSLKMWFVIRKYGIQGLQNYIRNHCQLAKRFETHVKKDSRFEIMNEVKMGLVCFRLKATNKMNMELLASINSARELHMIPSLSKDKYIIRFCVVAEHATEDDIDTAWSIIQRHADVLTKPLPEVIPTKPMPPLLIRRHSFTRGVSQDVFQRSQSRNSLHDGATPIIISEDENENIFDEVFRSNPTIKEE